MLWALSALALASYTSWSSLQAVKDKGPDLLQHNITTAGALSAQLSLILRRIRFSFARR